MDQEWKSFQGSQSRSFYRTVHEEDVQSDQVQIIPETAEPMGIRTSSERARQRELFPSFVCQGTKRLLSPFVPRETQGNNRRQDRKPI